MSDQNSAVVLRWFNEVWNNSNEHAIDEMFHPDGKAHGLGSEPLKLQEFKAFYQKMNNLLADIKVSVDKTLTQDDYVIAMCTVQARHRETSKPVSFTGVSIGKIGDNQIIEAWNYFDFLNLNLQLGNITHEQLA